MTFADPERRGIPQAVPAIPRAEELPGLPAVQHMPETGAERKFSRVERELLWYLEANTTEENRWLIPEEEQGKKTIIKDLSVKIDEMFRPGENRGVQALSEAVSDLKREGCIDLAKTHPDNPRTAIVNIEITPKGLAAADKHAEQKKLALEEAALPPENRKGKRTRGGGRRSNAPPLTLERLAELSETSFWQIGSMLKHEIKILEADIKTRQAKKSSGGQKPVKPLTADDLAEQSENLKKYFGDTDEGKRLYAEYLIRLSQRMEALIAEYEGFRNSELGKTAVSPDIAA